LNAPAADDQAVAVEDVEELGPGGQVHAGVDSDVQCGLEGRSFTQRVHDLNQVSGSGH